MKKTLVLMVIAAAIMLYFAPIPIVVEQTEYLVQAESAEDAAALV